MFYKKSRNLRVVIKAKSLCYASPLLDNYTYTIENPSGNEKDDFLKCSWDNLQNIMDEAEKSDVDSENNLAPSFTLVRDRKKKKKN